MSTIRELLTEGRDALSDSSLSPRLDAEVLLAHVLSCTRLDLISGASDSPTTEEHNRFISLIARRQRSEPVAYLLGEKEFFGRTFKVSPAVLIPRPETELLVSLSLEVLEQRKAPGRELTVLELGAGSGCISITLSCELSERGIPHHIVSVDKSISALNVARENLEKFPLVQSCVQFIESDWCSAVTGEFDLIVSNPPYVVEGSPDISPETAFEPSEALFSGDQGLSDIIRIAEDSFSRLRRGGVLLSEIGASQGEVLLQRARQKPFSHYRELTVYPDLAGRARVLRLVML